MQFPVAFVLFLAFLVLKLCGVIAWSWWWITAPLWGALVLTIVLIILFGIGAVAVVRKVDRRR